MACEIASAEFERTSVAFQFATDGAEKARFSRKIASAGFEIASNDAVIASFVAKVASNALAFRPLGPEIAPVGVETPGFDCQTAAEVIEIKFDVLWRAAYDTVASPVQCNRGSLHFDLPPVATTRRNSP